MAKTLKDLGLALLNATLILFALCLFLALKVLDRADQVSENFKEAVQVVTPLRDEIGSVGTQLAGLREDLSELTENTPLDSAPQLAAIQTRLDALDTKLTAAQSRIKALSDEPGQLMGHAIETTADAIASRLSDLRGCVPAS